MILAQRAAEAERQIVQSRFEQEARSRILLVEELIKGQLRELDAMRRFITLESELTRHEFETLARLSDRVPMTVGWIENVSASHMAVYRKRMDYYYQRQFRLRLPESVEDLSSGDIRRHFPITYQKTNVPGANLVGMDLSYLPSRMHAFEQAMITGQAVMVAGIPTLDDPDDDSGIVVFAPVFNEDSVHDVTDRHYGNLRGFIGMGLRLSALARWVSSAHSDSPGMRLNFEEFASNSPAVSLVSDSRGLSFSRDIDLADGSVVIRAEPTDLTDWRPRPTALIAVVAGLAATFLCAGYLALTLRGRARAEASVIRRTAELQDALEALSESEARWQFALDGSGDGVWDWRLPENQVYFSSGWKTMLGYAPDEIDNTLGEWSDRLHPEDRKACRQALEAHFCGESDSYTSVHRMRCKDGRYKWILDRGKVTEWNADGRPTRMIGTHSDINHVKQTELELREVNAYLSGIFASAEDVAIMVTRPDGDIALFNRGAEKLLGYEAAEVVGRMTPLAFHDPGEVAAWGKWLGMRDGRAVTGFEVFRRCIEDGRHCSERWTYLRKDGERRKVQLTISGIFDESGKNLGLLGVAVDMTEYQRAVDALEQNDHLLQDLTANVPGVIYQFLNRPDGSASFPYVSDGIWDIFEITAEQAHEDAANALRRIHAEDAAAVQASIDRSRDNLVPWICEFRVVLPEHGVRWLRGESTPRRAEDGSTLWHGYISDITQMKTLEFQLREQATMDPLTGAFNRRHLETHWQREMARFRRQGMAFAMIMLDIDHFKTVNDSHGHDAGDEVLVRLGRLLRHEVRSTDVVYRLGGEEFLILCEDTDLEGAGRLAELLRDQLRQHPMPFPEPVTASFGVVEVSLDEPMPRAFKRLDELLYLAKANGRDQVILAPLEPVH
ncbi:diguanylate cyclase [Marinobacter halodurans]|uniref:diguanylate cyclase n=1 Tax=Marinobacter halodurans TaxID=2528979 RepID=A0ABY1ZLV5_9GAMM|nr:diguanylate cyclase [Marinobacter halodurans]TBW53763.1 diguanylate cyclase [Marinobacter halodurans]